MIDRARGARRMLSSAIGLLAWLLAGTAGAEAAGGRVVLLQPAGASAGIRRTMTLIRDELVAGGFEVVTVDPGPSLDPVSMAKRMGEQKGAVATVGLLGDPEQGPAELWILDRIGGAAEVRRIAAPREKRERAAEVLAIRTIELLRASALKLLIEANRPRSAAPATSRPSATAAPPSAAPAVVSGAAAAAAAAPSPIPPDDDDAPDPGDGVPSVEAPAPPADAGPPTLVRPPAAPPESRPRPLALETGVSLLVSPGELAPAAVPVARLRYEFAAGLAARLSVAGLGTRPRVETDRGSAAIAQELALLELAMLFRLERQLRPFLTLGAGALHVRSESEGTFPYLGRDDARWSTLLAAGGGAMVTLGSHLAIALEAQALLASPHPVVRFVELESARVGRPALWTTLTLVARL